MVIVILGLICLLAIAAIVAISRKFKWDSAPGGWRMAFCVMAVLGVAAGLWFSFSFEYHAKPTMRVAGFPVPLAFFVKEGESWTDFVPPFPLQLGGICANVLCMVAVFLSPLLARKLG